MVPAMRRPKDATERWLLDRWLAEAHVNKGTIGHGLNGLRRSPQQELQLAQSGRRMSSRGRIAQDRV